MADDARACGDAGSVHARRCLNAPSPKRSRADTAERFAVAVALGLATLLAWLWLWEHRMPPGAVAMDGMDMSGMAMPTPPPPLGTVFMMWALMMVAMMLPSASPMILLHARLMTGTGQRRSRRMAATMVFALAYVLVWTAAAFLAAAAQTRLTATGVVSHDAMALGDPVVAGVLLVVAGLYQLTPLKQVCLERCRSPLSFLMQRWRPDIKGAMRLGLRHGLFCLGCCWLLMALLFVGGVMNLAWVALLALVVLAEKVLPGGRLTALVLGVIACFGGIALIAHGLGVISLSFQS